MSTSASRRTLSLRAHYIRRLLRFNAALATVTYIVWGSVFEWLFAAIFGGYSPHHKVMILLCTQTVSRVFARAHPAAFTVVAVLRLPECNCFSISLASLRFDRVSIQISRMSLVRFPFEFALMCAVACLVAELRLCAATYFDIFILFPYGSPIVRRPITRNGKIRRTCTHSTDDILHVYS